MFYSGYLPFSSAQYVRDVHEVIVDNIGEMIRRESIGFYYDWVTFVFCHIVYHFAVDNVNEFRYI